MALCVANLRDARHTTTEGTCSATGFAKLQIYSVAGGVEPLPDGRGRLAYRRALFCDQHDGSIDHNLLGWTLSHLELVYVGETEETAF
jgi:hypothetical protein